MRILLTSGEVRVPSSESANTVRCEPSWEATVDLLRDEVEKRGAPITHLEIHCHGHPAALDICQTVDHQNIESFAAALNTVMSPWGYIELLACLVAQHPIAQFGAVGRVMFPNQLQLQSLDAESIQAQSQSSVYTIRSGLPSEISGLPPATIREDAAANYFRPIFDAARAKSKNNLRPTTSNSESRGFMLLEARRADTLAQIHKQFSPDQIDTAQSILEQALLTKDFGQKNNGLDFCVRMARSSQCIVRASEVEQTETSGDIIEFDTFGDWEGRVWDFMPDGSITYLGYCLSRAGIPYPAHWSGSLAVV
jgi:hypothetical protein